MYDFRDYHRTIVAFHGTTMSEADRLVDGQAFTPSSKSTEWLGKGVYFWEYAPQQAWWWSKSVRKHPEPAVVGAMIRLGNCLDLLDPANVRWLRRYYDDLVPNWTDGKAPIPRNVLSNKGMDCAILNWAYSESDITERKIETSRGVYVPTNKAKRVWPGVGFMTRPISRSASASKETFSQSGTSAPTDVTEGENDSSKRIAEAPIAKPVYPPGIAGTLQEISDRLKKMTAEEFQESLRRAGIIDANGNLTPQYRTPKKKIRRAPRRKPRSKFL